jgi:hypothetical protein
MRICTQITIDTVRGIVEKIEKLDKATLWIKSVEEPSQQTFERNNGILYLYCMDNELFWGYTCAEYCEEVDNYSFVRMIELDC